MSVDVNDSLKNKSNRSDLYYSCQPNSGTPWPSVAAAHAGIEPAYRSGGKLILIGTGTNIALYTYQGGVAQANLLPVLGSGTSSGGADGFSTYLSVAKFRDTFDGVSPIINLTDPGKEGVFIYDATDTASADNEGATVLVKDDKRFIRLDTKNVLPSWFGAVGDGVADDKVALTAAGAWATSKNKTLIIEEGKNYLITASVTVQCNVGGFGTIRTRGAATRFICQKTGGTVENFKVDGNLSGVPDGGGLFITNATYVMVRNIRVEKVTGAAGIYASFANNLKIFGCQIKTVRSAYGDGIYFSHSDDVEIIGNTCEDFQRIGIAGEQQSTYPKISLNTCEQAFAAIGGQINAGIWIENVYGGEITNNTVKDTLKKTYCIIPATTGGITYTYIFNGNTAINAEEGLSWGFAEDQILLADSNHFIDMDKGCTMETFKFCRLSNCVWSLKNKLDANTYYAIRFQPTKGVGKKSELIVDSCKNYNGIAPGIQFINEAGQQGDLTVINCQGNWYYDHLNTAHSGFIKYVNTKVDFSVNPLGGKYLMCNDSVEFIGCDIKLPVIANFMAALGGKMTFDNCNVTAGSLTNIYLGAFGSLETVIKNRTKFTNVYLHDLRRPGSKIMLLDSDFDSYAAQGFINNTVVALGYLEARGCKFGPISSVIPLQFANGVTDSVIGDNIYYTSQIHNGFIPKTQPLTEGKGVSASRPSNPHVGYVYYDTSINRRIIWTGTEWTGAATYASNAATAAPTKAGLNATYGFHMPGTKIIFADIVGGAREYEKFDSTNTSNWREIIWSTGVVSLVA